MTTTCFLGRGSFRFGAQLNDALPKELLDEERGASPQPTCSDRPRISPLASACAPREIIIKQRDNGGGAEPEVVSQELRR